jgi:hypothetical protein
MAMKRANISEITRWRVRAEGWACNPDKKTSSWFCFEEEFDNGKDAFNLGRMMTSSKMPSSKMPSSKSIVLHHENGDSIAR